MLTLIKLLACFIALCFFVCEASIIGRQQHPEIDTEVILVHAICRHGKRTTYSFYPNDPHKNNSFYPVGPGGMLNEGKKDSFQLGELLRKEYDNLLGSTYTDNLIMARSTDTIRTRMTAQLILAGLFPPNEEQMWHDSLKWLPIPVYTKDSKNEDTINPNCEYRKKLLEELPKNKEIYEKYIKPYENLFAYVEQHSGKPIKSLSDLVEFYFIINTEEEMGLQIPEWTKKIYPSEIYDAISNVYSYQNSNLNVRKIHIGYLLRQILGESRAKAKGILKPADRKMFLYGAHESTLGWLMDHLKIFEKPHIPPYSSSLIFEVHQDKAYANKHYIKIRYLSKHNEPIKTLKMQECNVLCPLDEFIRVNDEVIPKVNFLEMCSGAISNLKPFSILTISIALLHTYLLHL